MSLRWFFQMRTIPPSRKRGEKRRLCHVPVRVQIGQSQGVKTFDHLKFRAEQAVQSLLQAFVRVQKTGEASGAGDLRMEPIGFRCQEPGRGFSLGDRLAQSIIQNAGVRIGTLSPAAAAATGGLGRMAVDTRLPCI